MAAASKSNKPELVRNRSTSPAKQNSRFAFPSSAMPHGLQMIFKDYSYSKYVVSGPTGPGGASQFARNTGTSDVVLPFPRTLNDSTNIRVTQFERDFLTERLVGGLSSITKDFQGTTEKILSATREAGKAASNLTVDGLKGIVSSAIPGLNSDQLLAASSYLARNYLSGDLAKNVGVLSERVVNPQETLAFSGVDLRSFSFSWDLFPANASDSEQIKEIVRFVKSKSLPQVEGLSSIPGLERAFLKYPSVVELTLLGVDENHFVRFKPCMVTNIDVSYGSGGMVSIINGGVPNAVTLTIGFMELAIQTAEDYQTAIENDPTLGMTDFNPGFDSSTVA